MTYRVLIIDDSRFARKSLTSIINKDPLFEVVATAMDGEDALQKMKSTNPDLITLDLEMPGMDGMTVLPKIISQFQIPVLIVSSLSKEGADVTIQALSLGAADFITKPSGSSLEIPALEKELIAKLKNMVSLKNKGNLEERLKFPTAEAQTKKNYYTPIDSTSKIILIGISTGGPSSLARILPKISAEQDATFIVVQHMPEHFTKSFAERLDSISALSVKEVEDGDILRKGALLIAKGGYHLTVEQSKNGLIARLNTDEKMNGHKPSVDKLFLSVTKLNIPNKLIAVLMTGMGADGAEGMGAILQKNGTTIAQDEESCIVFGMPKAAISKGYANHIVSLDEIPVLINKLIAEN